jgi:hypothetical protein
LLWFTGLDTSRFSATHERTKGFFTSYDYSDDAM